MYALLVFAERINDDAMWPLKYGSSSNLSHPASQKNVESPAPLLDAAIHRSSSSLLQVEEQPTNASGDHARNSQLDLSTSTPVTHRKSDESLGLATVPVTTAIATYARRPVPSEPIVPRGDLSVVSPPHSRNPGPVKARQSLVTAFRSVCPARGDDLDRVPDIESLLLAATNIIYRVPQT